MPDDGADERLVLLTYLVLTLVGMLLGLIGAFLVPQRLPGGVEGLSVVLACGGNALVGLLGGLGTRRTLGAVLPGLGWLLVVGVLTAVAPGNDVIIPGRLSVDPGVGKVGTGFLLLGIVGTAVALVVTTRYTARVRTPTQPR